MALFGCGHPREPENIKVAHGYATCRTCHNKYMSDYRRRKRAKLTPQEKFLDYRLRYLPGQIEATKRKLAALQNEARRYGMEVS